MSALKLEDARRVISAAEKKANEIGQPMNIAVADEGGNIVAHVRMDNAWIGSIDISMKKAYTSSAFEISMLPIQALSIRTWATMFPPSSATAMFMGCPISLAFFSAALITRRASSNFTAVIGSPFMCYAAAPDRELAEQVGVRTYFVSPDTFPFVRLPAFAAACSIKSATSFG